MTYDVAVANLPLADTLTGAELLPIYQGGRRVLTTLQAACLTKAPFSGAPAVVGLPGADAISGAEITTLFQNGSLRVSTLGAIVSTHGPSFREPLTLSVRGADALVGGEYLPVYQGGRRVLATINQIATYAGTQVGPSVLAAVPTIATVAANAAAGTLLFAIRNVPAGVIPTVSPNDGRFAIAGDATNGWKVVTGATALSAGSVNVTANAAGATGVTVPVTIAAVASPTVTISGAQSKAEGNSGATVFTYTVTRSVTSGAVSVPWTFTAGNTSADDFTGGVYPAGGSVVLADGQASGTFSISVNGDTVVEGDETFTVLISTPAGYVAGAATSATGTILNDDVAAGALPTSVLIVAEGDSITTGLQGSGGITSYVDQVMNANPFQLPGYAAGNTGSTTYQYRKVSQSGETALSMANGYNGTGGSAILAPGAGPAGGAGGQGIGAGPSYDSTKAMNIVTMHAGTNDNTISAEYQIYRALRSYQRQARATGYQRSIGSTIISRTNVTYTSTDTGVDHNFDGNTAPINLAIRAYWSSDLGYDYLCDYAADPAYDTQAHYAPNTPDGTHPSNAGYARMAAIYQAGLQAVINQATRTPRVQGLTFSKYDVGGNGQLSSDLKTFSVTTTGNTSSMVRGLPRMPVGSGKWYWEIITNSNGPNQIGLCTEAFEPYIYAKNGSLVNATASGGLAIAAWGDIVQFNNTILNGGTYYPQNGDIVQYCFDADTGLLWFRTLKAASGTYTNWNGSATADPATLTGGIDIRTGKLGSVSISPAAHCGSASAGVTSRFASAEQTLRYAAISGANGGPNFRSFDTATVPG